jgi:hypothetical protein
MPVSPARRTWIFPAFIVLIVAGVATALLHRGWSYYELSLEERPDHPDFRTLRQTGFIGLGYGFAGAALVFLNLLYLLRRRVSWMRSLGSMRVWLDLHVLTGLLAAVFVACHSTFVFRNNLAITAAVSLGVVVLTGVIGRFLFALVPTRSEQPLLGAVAALEALVPGIQTPVLAAIEAFPPPALPLTAGFIRALASVPAWRRIARQRREAVRLVVAQGIDKLDRKTRRRARRAERVIGRLAAADVRAGGSAALMRSWRALHRLFAILMLVAVSVHVGVAWHYGYRWIFTK